MNEVVEAFVHMLIDERPLGKDAALTWRGVQFIQHPVDAIIRQQVIWETKPNVIIETGTWRGGSAWFMADLVSHWDGHVVTIDREPKDTPPHPHAVYICGDSGYEKVYRQATSHIAEGARVMVCLDSDHRPEHVKIELDMYAPLVTAGCYLVADDTTNLKGPREAVAAYLDAHPGMFDVDLELAERYLFTMNTWMRRIV